MVNRQTNRAFGLTFAAVMGVIWVVAYLLGDVMLTWPPVVAAVSVALALALPSALLPLNRLWVVLLGGIGHVNNRLVLGFFFYVVVTPTGMLMRLVGFDPMHRKPEPASASYLTPVGRKADSETYRDLF